MEVDRGGCQGLNVSQKKGGGVSAPPPPSWGTLPSKYPLWG